MVGFGFGSVVVHPISNHTQELSTVPDFVPEYSLFKPLFPSPAVFLSLCLLFLNLVCNIIGIDLFIIILCFKQKFIYLTLDFLNRFVFVGSACLW